MTGWILEMLIATTLLLGLVLALRRPVARAFGPRIAYALWALPALRAVLPPLPGWQGLAIPALPAADPALPPIDPVTIVPAVAAPLPPLPIDAAPAATEALPWAALLLAIWMGGALLWFGWQMLRYHGFLRHALRQATLLTTECGIDVFVTPHVDGPVAAGVTARRIFLPADFLRRYTPVERRLALLHEAAHHDRRDILANLAALALLALHWWNPLAHRAYRAFRADQELACDATVLADVAAGDRHAYGSAVVKSVSARMPGVACALSHKEEIKRRLRGMAAPRIAAGRMRAGALVALAAIGVGLVATASGQAIVAEPPLSPQERAALRAEAAAARQEGLRAAEEARQAAAEAGRAAAEAQREAAAAEAEAAHARAAGLREAARARLEARREAAAARIEAAHAREAGLAAAARAQAAAQAQRGAAQAEAAAQARAAGLAAAARAQAAAQAQRGAAQAEAAAQARAVGLAAAARYRAEARHDAAQVRLDAEAARRDANAARHLAYRHDGDAAHEMAAVRRSMAARCATQGRPVSPDLDWQRLALCGDTAATIAARANAHDDHAEAEATVD